LLIWNLGIWAWDLGFGSEASGWNLEFIQLYHFIQ